MYRLKLVFLLFVVILAVSGRASAWAGGDEQSPTIPGFRGELLGQIDQAQKEIMQLEDAVPQTKFDWRPGEGVRSVSEVYLHIAFANYLLPKFAGYEPPADLNFVMDIKKWDTATTDKAKIAGALKRSFEHLRKIVTTMTDQDLEKKVTMFGQEMTIRNTLLAVLSHIHEHLGQSIAYARMNGVVPPWTAEEQAREKKATTK